MASTINRGARRSARTNDPAAARTGDVGSARSLEHVRVIVCQTVHQLAAREQPIPDLLHPGHAAAAQVVHEVVAVVDLEQLDALEAQEIVARNRPGEVGMVDVRHAVGRVNGVDVPLDRVDHRAPLLRFDFGRDVEAVDVNRLLVVASR